MSVSISSAAPVINQASSFSGTCKSCGESNFSVRSEPPHYALRCRSCGKWQRWIAKSEARRYQREKGRLNVPPKPISKTAIMEDLPQEPTDNYRVEIDELKERIAGIERELLILIRVEANCGLQRVRPRPPEVDISENNVDRLVRELTSVA
jgi:hypothetical protein